MKRLFYFLFKRKVYKRAQRIRYFSMLRALGNVMLDATTNIFPVEAPDPNDLLGFLDREDDDESEF